ncbi:unnamed protein product [Symbiodinium sp. CCMP2592]|nr:unnamed protein product [Symbiodinium sp. CCMP2592]
MGSGVPLPGTMRPGVPLPGTMRPGVPLPGAMGPGAANLGMPFLPGTMGPGAAGLGRPGLECLWCLVQWALERPGLECPFLVFRQCQQHLLFRQCQHLHFRQQHLFFRLWCRRLSSCLLGLSGGQWQLEMEAANRTDAGDTTEPEDGSETKTIIPTSPVKKKPSFVLLDHSPVSPADLDGAGAAPSSPRPRVVKEEEEDLQRPPSVEVEAISRRRLSEKTDPAMAVKGSGSLKRKGAQLDLDGEPLTEAEAAPEQEQEAQEKEEQKSPKPKSPAKPKSKSKPSKPQTSPKAKAKGKAKAKAKGESKPPAKTPKAKSTAKATPQPKAKKTKPGKQLKEGDNNNKNVTRQESFADKALQWKLAAEDKAEAQEKPKEEPEAEEQDGDEEDNQGGEKRDLAKARKFKRMSDAGAIPEHIQEVLSKAKTRAAKTELINELFDKNDKGKLIMKSDKPVFETTKQAKHQKFGRDETMGAPKDVVLHRDYHGDEKALDASIARGTVMVWLQDGVEFAGYRQTVAGIGKTVEDKHQAKSGAKEITDETFQALDKAFRAMTFSFDQDDQPRQAIAAEAASSKEPPVLKQFTESQQALLEEAKGAMERLHSAAMRMISKCSQAKDKESFKPHMLAMKSWMDRDDHLLLWKEFPDSERPLTAATFKDYMCEHSETAVSLNEEREKFKALLKARSFDAEHTLPLQLHGDGTPVVGIGKIWSRQLTSYTWNSLLAVSRRYRGSPSSRDAAGEWCRGDNSDSSWHDCRTSARWLTLGWTRESWLAYPERSSSAIFSNATGLTPLNVHYDYMHCKYLGADQISFGSVLDLLVSHLMADSPLTNLGQCWDKIVTSYKRLGISERYRGFRKLTMFQRKKKCPKLKGRAGQIAAFGEPLLELWEEHMHPDLAVHCKIRTYLRLNIAMEKIMKECRAETAFPEPQATNFIEYAFAMCNLHMELGAHFEAEGLKLFSPLPKLHLLLHTVLLCRHINPRLTWCYKGEDLQKVSRSLAASCARGLRGPAVTVKMVSKLRAAWNLRLSKVSAD